MANEKKRALLTGATSGFGRVIALHLLKCDYKLVFFARSKAKSNAFIEELKKEIPNCEVDAVLCDLASFASMKIACENVVSKYSNINLLILNAGMWNFEFKETEDKIEETLQVNLLAPIYLLRKLHSLIPTDGNSKVIFTASGLHQGTLQFNDLEFRAAFSGFKSYRQSKLGVILMTRLLAKSSDYAGISMYCVHPGVVRTALGKNANWFSRAIFWLIGKSAEKGARTHVHLIDTPTEKLTSGEYYANSKVIATSKEANDLNEAKQLNGVIDDYLRPF